MKNLSFILSFFLLSFLFAASPVDAYFYDNFDGTFDATNVTFGGACVESGYPEGKYLQLNNDNFSPDTVQEWTRALYLYRVDNENLVGNYWQDVGQTNESHPHCIVNNGGLCTLENLNEEYSTHYDETCDGQSTYKIVWQSWNGDEAHQWLSNQSFTYEQVYGSFTETGFDGVVLGAFTGSLTDGTNWFVEIIATVLPWALGILALYIGVRFGIIFFRKNSGVNFNGAEDFDKNGKRRSF